MATITGLRLSELTQLSLGTTGTKFYAVTSSNNSFWIAEKNLYQTMYNLHLSGVFQPKNEDWRFIHVTGNETLTGTKIFTQLTKFNAIHSSGAWIPLITGNRMVLGSAGNISGSNINLAGYNNTTPCFGENAGSLNSAGSNGLPNSVVIGSNAGKYANASSVVFIGYYAGASDLSASSNLGAALAATNSVFIGDSAGLFADNSTDCVYLGYNAGASATSAANSVFIGSSAGANMSSASACIFIGNSAGVDRPYTLCIDPTSASTPLIYGEFDTRLAQINGNQKITGYVSGNMIMPGTDGILFKNNLRLFSNDTNYLKLEDANGPTDILSYNMADEILTIVESCTVGEVFHVNNYSNLMGNTRIEKLIISGTAPSTPTSAGISGQVGLSGQKLFICTGTNKWGYINITPWI